MLITTAGPIKRVHHMRALTIRPMKPRTRVVDQSNAFAISTTEVAICPRSTVTGVPLINRDPGAHAACSIDHKKASRSVNRSGLKSPIHPR
ncbi:hypothetical protein [Sphingomonas paucimobilis]|uniref:hypothetical protein n=1 Tax=Sphingomonas paucimobilis TaxID=13689 RepID=UPI0031E1782F